MNLRRSLKSPQAISRYIEMQNLFEFSEHTNVEEDKALSGFWVLIWGNLQLRVLNIKSRKLGRLNSELR